MNDKERLLQLIEQMDESQLQEAVGLLTALMQEEKVQALAEAPAIYRTEKEKPEVEVRRVGDLTVMEFKEYVYQAVVEALMDFLGGDPDAGLELRESFIEELQKSLEEEERGEVVGFQTIKEEFGLK